MDQSCTLCGDAVYNTGSYFETQCLHCFHCSCLEQWLTQSCICPECKSEITKEGLTKFSQLRFYDEYGNEEEIYMDELVKKLPPLKAMPKEGEKGFIVIKGFSSKDDMQKVEKQLKEKTLINMELVRQNLELKTLKALSEMVALCLGRLVRLLAEQNNLKKENLARGCLKLKLLPENKTLKSKVEYLKNMKLILERRPKDIEEIWEDMPIDTFSEEEKLAIDGFASNYTKLQKDLCDAEEKYTQLQNELTKEK